MRADRAAILELDEQGGMRFSAWTGLSNEYRARALLRLPWAENADDWSAVLVRDVDADAALSRERAHLRAEGIGALVYVPLIDDGRQIGRASCRERVWTAGVAASSSQKRHDRK